MPKATKGKTVKTSKEKSRKAAPLIRKEYVSSYAEYAACCATNRAKLIKRAIVDEKLLNEITSKETRPRQLRLAKWKLAKVIKKREKAEAKAAKKAARAKATEKKTAKKAKAVKPTAGEALAGAPDTDKNT